MKNRLLVAAASILLLTISLGIAVAWSGQPTAEPLPFATAVVRFEQNATDGDVEVVFEITGGDDGLTKLTIVAPNGRTIADFAAPDRATLGLRQFVLESPEPSDAAALKAAYPEGDYLLRGTTTSGLTLASRATLTHSLPATTTFVRPQADAKDVDARNLEIAWSAVADSKAYVVELEEEGADKSLVLRIPPAATRFRVPDGFLQPGKEYSLGIGVVSAAGNVSFVETSFETAR